MLASERCFKVDFSFAGPALVLPRKRILEHVEQWKDSSSPLNHQPSTFSGAASFRAPLWCHGTVCLCLSTKPLHKIDHKYIRIHSIHTNGCILDLSWWVHNMQAEKPILQWDQQPWCMQDAEVLRTSGSYFATVREDGRSMAAGQFAHGILFGHLALPQDNPGCEKIPTVCITYRAPRLHAASQSQPGTTIHQVDRL